MTSDPLAARAQDVTMATPRPIGPAIPPELTVYAMDWPVAQGSLSAHRAAPSSPISATTVDRLAVAWRFPLTAVGGFGAVTATPLVSATPSICKTR